METTITYDDFLKGDLPEYLLTQEGINKASMTEQGYLSKIIIKYNNKTNPYIINEHIKLFQEQKELKIMQFKKGIIKNTKVINYTINDICCEYCYKSFVDELFNNKKIESVESNFDNKKSSFEVIFKIEYDENYIKEELINFLKEKE